MSARPPVDALYEVTIVLCGQCMNGEGGECHQPGCALWMNRAPDVALWDSPMVMYRPVPSEAPRVCDGCLSLAEDHCLGVMAFCTCMCTFRVAEPDDPPEYDHGEETADRARDDIERDEATA